MRSIRSTIAPIRFGYGQRLGEAAPDDPVPWLEAQLAGPGTPPPGGVTTAQALRARTEMVQNRAPAAGSGRENRGAAPDRSAEFRRRYVDLVRNETEGWAERRLTSPEPFRDRLVDFWMNHFTVSRRGAVIPLPGPLEREAIRPHVTGRFADMLVAVTRHPAMLIYLDNHLSIGPRSELGQRSRRGLNENLAREVLELHTLSPAGGYTQGDVQELAKILTGWSVAVDREPFGFVWRQEAHEPGQKALLGRRFPEGGQSQEAALRFLGNHQATYRHLAVKLARHFVADVPPPTAIRTLEDVLKRSDGDLGAMSKALIGIPEAWDPPLSKFRPPADYILAAGRAIGMENGGPVLSGMASLGQRLWGALQPNGWGDTIADWAGPEALMRRVDWAYTFAGWRSAAEPAQVVETALGPFARAETVDAMRGAGSVQDALTILFSSPEFMRR